MASGHFSVPVFGPELVVPAAAIVTEYFPLQFLVALAGVMVKEPSFLELHSAQGTSEQSSDSSPDSLLWPLHQGQASPQEHKVTISLHNHSLKLEVTLPLGHKAQAEAKLCLGLYPFYSILYRIFIFLPDNFQLLHIIRAEIRNLVLFQTPNKWHNYKYFCNLYALSEQENKRLKSILYIRLC